MNMTMDVDLILYVSREKPCGHPGRKLHVLETMTVNAAFAPPTC